jgi:hypothetical protein
MFWLLPGAPALRIGVSTNHGITQATLTPYGFHSTSSASDKPRTANLVAE